MSVGDWGEMMRRRRIWALKSVSDAKICPFLHTKPFAWKFFLRIRFVKELRELVKLGFFGL